jgi:hypothetical protein
MDAKDPRNEDKAPFLDMWKSKDAWAPLMKKGSFGHKSYSDKVMDEKEEKVSVVQIRAEKCQKLKYIIPLPNRLSLRCLSPAAEG